MWDKIYSGKLVQPAKCWSTLVVANTLSVIHVVMDFVLLLTPIIVLWNVRLNKKTKIRLFIVFSMGSLSCVASILRELAQKSISKDITCKITPSNLIIYLLTLHRRLHKSFGMDCSRPDARSSRSITPCHQHTNPKGMGRSHTLITHPYDHTRTTNIQNHTRKICYWKDSTQHHRFGGRRDFTRRPYRVILCSKLETIRTTGYFSDLVVCESPYGTFNLDSFCNSDFIFFCYLERPDMVQAE
jgi:hypothetical protein